MSDEIKTTNTEQPNTQTPEASGGQGVKMFTQDEVNRIVSERLAREREKLTQQPQEDEREKALREREKALEARENRAACQDYLDSLPVKDKYKTALLEALDTSDAEKFKATAEKLIDTIGLRIETKTVGAQTAKPPMNVAGTSFDAQIAAAFKPKI